VCRVRSLFRLRHDSRKIREEKVNATLYIYSKDRRRCRRRAQNTQGKKITKKGSSSKIDAKEGEDSKKEKKKEIKVLIRKKRPRKNVCVYTYT
jgi:hypothetical protein